MAADHEHQVAGMHFALRNEFAESRRIQRPASWVEQDFARARVTLPEIRASGTDLAHFRGGVTTGAGQKIRGNGVAVRVLRLADEIKIDLHSAGISTVLALRQ